MTTEWSYYDGEQHDREDLMLTKALDKFSSKQFRESLESLAVVKLRTEGLKIVRLPALPDRLEGLLC